MIHIFTQIFILVCWRKNYVNKLYNFDCLICFHSIVFCLQIRADTNRYDEKGNKSIFE